MPLLLPLHSCFALGRWFPNTNLEQIPFPTILYFTIQIPWHPGVLTHFTPGSQNSVVFLPPPWHSTLWPGKSHLPEGSLEWELKQLLDQIRSVPQFCLKPAMPWSSKLCRWPWLLTPFPSLPSLPKCSVNSVPEKTRFSRMPTFDQDFCSFTHESFQNLLNSRVCDLCSCWPRGQGWLD